MSHAKHAYKHPLLWVPTSYFTMGMVYITVVTASNILFKNLGMDNGRSALFSSLLGFTFTFKPLWSPVLELFKSKKWWVILMQFMLAVGFGLMASALHLKNWFIPVFAVMILTSIMGATQDIGTDGVYITTLGSSDQAKFTGIQSASWNLGPLLVTGPFVLLVGKLAGERTGFTPPVENYAQAWSMMLGSLAVVAGAMAIWHRLMLPEGSKVENAPKSMKEGMATFWDAFVTFFQKKDIWMMLAFAFFYRSAYAMLEKIAPLFLLDARDKGGLGLNNMTMGTLNGIVGTAAFLFGSVVGGWIVSRIGLKKTLLFLCLALNVPNVTLLYLGVAQPNSLFLIGSVFFIEKFFWGLGCVGLMIYMMQQMAPGPYKTAHYAFSTGLGFNLCGVIMGSLSGFLQVRVGYKTYFILALLAAIPSILFTILAPFNQSTSEGAEEKPPAGPDHVQSVSEA